MKTLFYKELEKINAEILLMENKFHLGVVEEKDIYDKLKYINKEINFLNDLDNKFMNLLEISEKIEQLKEIEEKIKINKLNLKYWRLFTGYNILDRYDNYAISLYVKKINLLIQKFTSYPFIEEKSFIFTRNI